jgi:hypothetical protein
MTSFRFPNGYTSLDQLTETQAGWAYVNYLAPFTSLMHLFKSGMVKRYEVFHDDSVLAFRDGRATVWRNVSDLVNSLDFTGQRWEDSWEFGDGPVVDEADKQLLVWLDGDGARARFNRQRKTHPPALSPDQVRMMKELVRCIGIDRARAALDHLNTEALQSQTTAS